MKKYINIVIILLIIAMAAQAQTAEPAGGAKPVAEKMLDPIPSRGIEAKAIDSTGISADLRDTVALGTAMPGRFGRKSIKRAFFMSLLVPGAGEYYTGNTSYTRGFLGTEGVIWSVWLVSNFQERMWRKDYIGYAALEAGSNPTREDDAYYKNMYDWPNSDWYNEYQWAEARDLYPNDPTAQANYVADKLYNEADAWEWQNASDWDYFRSLRVKSLNSKQRKNYALGAALLNRLLSAVNAARLAKSYNRAYVKKRKSLSLDLNLFPTPEGRLAMAMTGRF